jgi:DNA polymerase-3 subunit alpha
MTMDISNQNKLSEFYEELKRLNVEVVRPDINECFEDFRTIDNKFYYALGGIKAVGFEAISNIVEERTLNGKFLSIHDFINRVNPKDINKLQLEGLVKAGAFDKINTNRQALFDSIPTLIAKSKNIFDNKSVNQIDLFSDDENDQDDILTKSEDWKFEERLSKEFEAVGFFISDHPLNQFTEIFSDYKILDYSNFISKEDLKDANIAATLLKVQERKTAKGNSYAVLKLTDLSSVFELFIFSDVLELNREILKEGSSLILTLFKNVSNDENRLTRINVQKIASLKELFNSPINEVSFKLKSKDQLEKISSILKDEGKTVVNINLVKEDNILQFRLKNPRKLDRKLLNLLRNQEIQAIIN